MTGSPSGSAATFEPVVPDPESSGEPQRPEVRVAAFGLADKFRRILEIVFRHARHNPYRFVLAPAPGGGQGFDVALVDMTAQDGMRVLQTLRSQPKAPPVVTVGRRADPTRAQDDLLMQRFALNLLSVLNGVVERHVVAPAQRGAAAVARAARAWAGLDDAEQRLGRRPRALMVDPSTNVRRQLSLALQQMAIDSEGVGSAMEARDVISVRRYELVFVEAALPDGSGLKLTRDFKRDPALRGTAVVVLTRQSGVLETVRGALSGCDAFLVKPVTLQTLQETVARSLRKALSGLSRSGDTAAA